LGAGAILGLGAFGQGGFADRAEHLGDVFFIHQGFLLDFEQIRLSIRRVAFIPGTAILGSHFDFLLWAKSDVHHRLHAIANLFAANVETGN
jgi:hypothetical protein